MADGSMNCRWGCWIGLVVWLVACQIVQGGEVGTQAGHDHLGPQELALSPDGRLLYVACTDAGQVAWVRLPEGDLVRRVAVPGRPTGLAVTPDGSRLAVTCAAPRSTVMVLDAVSGRRLAAIPAGHTAMGPVLGPDGHTLYVCNRFDHDVSVIDLRRAQEVARVAAVREPVDAAVTPDGRAVLVANHLPLMRANVTLLEEVTPVVTLIDTRTHRTTELKLPSGSHSLRAVSVTPDGRYAMVTHLLGNFQETPFRVDMGWINTNVVSIIELAEYRLKATIGLDELDLGAGNPWDVAISPDGQRVCVSLSGTHQMGLIGTSELVSEEARRTMSPMMGVWPIYLSLGASLWRRVDLAGQGPRGIAARAGRAYVAEYFSDTVAVVNLEGGGNGQPQRIRLGPPPTLSAARRGEMLFHDATLCYQHWQSCASCHPDGRTDALNWDLLNDGSGNPKNTRSLVWSHRTPPVMALGVRPSAEAAVRAGLVHILFADRPEEEAAAIDAYLRSLTPVPSPYLVGGRLSRAARRGQRLFLSPRTGCRKCHPPPLYTDLKSHDVGTQGRYGRNARFDTPTLVEVWRTAPYLHDGRYTSVRQLLVEGHHGLSPQRMEELSQQDIDDLVEFVLSL